jgi:histone acetyltransferase (RNA polymerase elongator complex component)
MSGRPFIAPVFIPHAGCPHRCVFCNQSAVTGRVNGLPTPEGLRESVAAFLKHRGRRRGPVQIAFYGGNFLGVAEEGIRTLLAEAAGFIRSGDAQGIRFSTRPDTVTTRTLALIEAYPVQTVELGAQSMNAEVLAQTQRGHTPTDTLNACRLLKARGYELGLQIMVGLPGDDENRLLQTGRCVVGLKPDFVRIYPTLVLAGSRLETLYRRGGYSPLPLEKAVSLTLKLYRLFWAHGIPVIRMGLQATKDLSPGGSVLAGPYHPAFGHLVQCAAFLEAVRNALGSVHSAGAELSLRVHPRSISRMRGLRNATIEALQREYGFARVAVCADAALAEDEIGVGGTARVAAFEWKRAADPPC